MRYEIKIKAANRIKVYHNNADSPEMAAAIATAKFVGMICSKSGIGNGWSPSGAANAIAKGSVEVKEKPLEN